MGYQGGVGAFLTVQRRTVSTWTRWPRQLIRRSPPHLVGVEELSGLGHEEKDATFGLSSDTFCVCDSLKRCGARRARRRTPLVWDENTVRVAIRSPAKTFTYGRFKVRYENAWLRIQLPSGRALCYPSARVEEGDRGQISYMGINPYSRKWCRLKTYGGKLTENITQAIARDLLYHGMLLAEKSGYEVILSVHDELLTELPEGDERGWEGLAACMAKNPPWAEGLPLAAAGFTDIRYRKD